MYLYRILVFCLVIASPLTAQLSEEEIGKRIHTHLIVKDYPSAVETSFQGLQLYPQSKAIGRLSIVSLAKIGDDRRMMTQWQRFISMFPEEKENRDLLECLCWAVIEKGADSSSPIIRAMAMLGAFFSQDTKGIAVLKQRLNDQNSYVRGAALKLSSRLPDMALQEEVLRLIKTEPVLDVRLEAMVAAGTMHIQEAKEELSKVLINENAYTEEKKAAIGALVLMSEQITKEQIQQLVKSNRAGMRLLACECVEHFEQEEDLPILLPLLQDTHPEVRAKMYQLIGLLRVKEVGGIPVAQLALNGIKDPDPQAAIFAAWTLTLVDEVKGQQALSYYLKHRNREIRHLASAALASTGQHGFPLIQNAFRQESDPYVRMNLAVGLIGQRVCTQEACDCLFDCLVHQKEKWMVQDVGNFQVFTQSTIKHDDTIPNKPEVMNQMTRLTILELLAITQFPKAQSALKQFLGETNWQISGLAAALLLTEGDDSAIDLVKGLLNDPDEKIRLQAALILAMWGRDEESIQTLQLAYAGADREQKEKILEGVGRVASPSSLLFLADKLQEPYQTLRIIAAAALLECLYR